MRIVLILVCGCAILLGCGGETATEKPETPKPSTGSGIIAPGVHQSTINPQGARQGADRAREDLNKAASDLQKNLDRAKDTRGD